MEGCEQHSPVGSVRSFKIKDALRVVRQSAAPQLPGSRGDYDFNDKHMVDGWRIPVVERRGHCNIAKRMARTRCWALKTWLEPATVFARRLRT